MMKWSQRIYKNEYYNKAYAYAMCYIIVDEFRSIFGKGTQNMHGKSLARWSCCMCKDKPVTTYFCLWRRWVATSSQSLFVAHRRRHLCRLRSSYHHHPHHHRAQCSAVLGACARGLLFWYFLRYFYAHFHFYAHGAVNEKSFSWLWDSPLLLWVK